MSRTSMKVDSKTPKVTETESYKSSFTFAIGKIRFSEIIRRKLPVDPYGHLTIDIEIGTIIIEFTDDAQIEINIREEWKSRWLLLITVDNLIVERVSKNWHPTLGFVFGVSIVSCMGFF